MNQNKEEEEEFKRLKKTNQAFFEYKAKKYPKKSKNNVFISKTQKNYC